MVRRKKESGGRRVHSHSIGSRNQRVRAMRACAHMDKSSNDADAHSARVREVAKCEGARELQVRMRVHMCCALSTGWAQLSPNSREKVPESKIC